MENVCECIETLNSIMRRINIWEYFTSKEGLSSGEAEHYIRSQFVRIKDAEIVPGKLDIAICKTISTISKWEMISSLELIHMKTSFLSLR